MTMMAAMEPIGFGGVCDDALLLHEFAHRTANEVAAAAAAIHLARRARPLASARLLERAAWRLEAFGDLNRLLARPVRRCVNVADDLSALCQAVAAGALAGSGSEIACDAPTTWIDGGTARRLVLVAAELVANAVRHALDGRIGRIDVSLRVVGADVVLRVGDDGGGIRPDGGTSGTGLGGGIVSQLVGRARGTIRTDTGPTGTTVCAAFPLPENLDDDLDF